MGAWGYEPKQSDAALDEFDTVSGFVDAALAKLFGVKCKKPDERFLTRCHRATERTESRTERVRAGAWQARFNRAGVVQILLERGFFLPRPIVAQAVEDLTFILEDEKTMTDFGWRNEGAARKDIERVRNAMQALLAVNPCVPTIYPNRGWPYLDPPPPRMRRSRRKQSARAKRRNTKRLKIIKR